MEVGRNNSLTGLSSLVASSSSLSLSSLGFDQFRGNSDWREWEESLDALDCPGLPFEMDMGFDNFLMATADDFVEPFNNKAALVSPSSTAFSSEYDHESEEEATLMAAVLGSKLNDEPLLENFDVNSCSSISETQSDAMQRHRKRKNPEMQRQQEEEKKIKVQPTTSTKKNSKALNINDSNSAADLVQIKQEMMDTERAEAERMFRRRYDILHEILEAWNTGGIEDMEEIADTVYDNDVTFISPDYSEGLRGVEAIMSHWNLLLDAFPDGIMEEYEIQREDIYGDKMKATWVFSGTQIYPIFGIQPRHEKVCISGTSFFTFKGEKICQTVLSWNYREALCKLMGMQPSSKMVVLGSASSTEAINTRQ